MKKQILQRSFIGMLGGITLSYLITIAISLTYGTGEYYPCVPALAEQVGTQTGAVLVQTLLSALLGAVFGGASIIWALDHWSLVKQSLVYFALAAGAMLPVAYLSHWMEHSVTGILIYTCIFAAIFLIVWLIQYAIWRGRIKKLNRVLEK